MVGPHAPLCCQSRKRPTCLVQLNQTSVVGWPACLPPIFFPGAADLSRPTPRHPLCLRIKKKCDIRVSYLYSTAPFNMPSPAVGQSSLPLSRASPRWGKSDIKNRHPTRAWRLRSRKRNSTRNLMLRVLSETRSRVGRPSTSRRCQEGENGVLSPNLSPVAPLNLVISQVTLGLDFPRCKFW